METADLSGRTPLMGAAVNGHLDLVKLLVNYGANIKAMDKDGKTATNWAQEMNHTEIVSFLDANS
jgi:uncharacterized protein